MTTPVQKVYENYLSTNIQEDARFDATKKWVWVPEDEQGYVKSEVTATTGDSYKVLTIHGEEKTVKQSLAAEVNPPKFDGVADNSDLAHLSEASVLHNLRLRYADNRIHTNSGLFLVVINPYKNLPIYTDDVIAMYNGKRRSDIAPHVYAIADEAYRATRDGKNQSILITGESGAGKTVNTKKVIQYLATIAGRRGAVGQLEEQIISANPILEAFGNAKTIRNDNSSRFGKFIQVQFTKSGFIAGAVIDHYLLEKSRVCKQSKDERNYHIFYQLFAGSSPAAKEQLQLTTPDQYWFLNGQGVHGGCYSILEVDDAQEFQLLKKSMDCVGISAEDQEAIFRIVAAVLHLGNIQFSQNSSDESFLKSKDPLEKACSLLRVAPDSLQFSLTKKKIKAPGQTIVANLNQEQASFSKEALAKACYDRMFDWLVKRINKSIDNDAKKANFIGVLDIAGFEIFDDELANSFEQLCINYTNEKLQQFFNHHMFKLEQEEYMKEKIVWDYEDFGLDLQPCIDLIEKPGCVLALLDEECVFPKATDATFLGKLDQKFAQHPNYEKTKLSKSGALLFSVKHYAGKVTYCVNNWLLKNMNPLGDDIVESMQTSLDPFVQSLFWVERSKQIATGGKKAAQFITISSQYKGQLFTLMTNLSLTDPHFIRCIKPNPEKKPGRLDAKEVLEQLRCNGVLEGIRIARKGYPSRLLFEDLKKRYALLAANKLPADPRTACETILNVIKADKTQYQVGRTKVFFRAGYLGHLEQLRENKQADSAKVIQRAYRKHLFRMRFARRKEEKNSAARIQRNIRAWINRKNAKWTKLYKGIKPLIQPNRVEQELKTTKHELDKMTEAKTQLESQNKALEDDIKSTKNQLESAFKDRERLQETKNNLENELNDTKEKLAYERSTSMARNQKQEALISELNTKLTQESQNVTNLEKTKKGLEGQVQELQTQLSEETAAKASLEATRKKLTGEIESLNSRLETEEKEKGELQRGKKKLENDLEALRAELAAEKKKNAELERQLLALRADLEQTKADLEKMTSLKNQLENAKKQLEAKVADLSEQVESTEKGKTGVEEAKKKLSREIQEIQDQLEAERTAVTKLEESSRALQSKYDELNLKNQKEIEAKAAANKQNEALQKDLSTLKEQLEAELAAKDNLQKSLKKATSDFDELKQKLEGEERGRGTAEQNRKRVETDLKQVQTQLEAALKGKASVEDTARTLQSELDELRDQLEFENKAKATLEKQRKQLEGKVEELKEELEAKSAGAEKSSQTLRRELELVREELEAEVDQKRRLETQNHDLEAQVAELKKKADAVDKAQVEEMKKNFNAQLATLQARLSEEEAAKTKFDGEAKKLKADLKALESRLDAESNERTQAEKQSKKYENDLKSVTGQLDNERKARNEQAAAIKKLEAQLAEQQTEYDNLAKAKVTTDRQLKTLQNELAEAQKQVEDEEKSKKKAAADFQNQLRDLQEQLEDESEAKRKLEDTRKVLEAEIATIKKNLANADASARAEEAKRVLQAEIDNLKLQVEEAGKGKTKAEKDASKLKDDLATAQAAVQEAENQKRKLQAKIKEVEARVEEEKNAASKVGGSISKLQQELQAAKARADEEAGERAKAASTIKTLQAKISQLESEHNEAEAATGTLKTKVKALEQSVNELRKEAEAESDLRARVESELKNAKAELDDLREHTEGSSSNAQRLERQYKTAQRQVSELEEQLQLAQDKAKEEVSKLKKKMQEQIDDLNSQLEKEVRAKSTATRQQRMLQRELDDTKARLEKLLALHDDA